MGKKSKPPEKTYKVFVSSTYLDNEERRQIVEDAILRANMMPIGMERFTASAQPTVESCLEFVKQADVLVGVIAWRYGWIPEGYDVSITKLEYDQARDRLMFEIDPSLPVNQQTDYDQGAERWQKQDKLDAFKQCFRREQMSTIFTDQTLGMKVLDALLKWKDEQAFSGEERLLRDYLDGVRTETHRINIQGIYSESGAGREPVYFPIEEHYTPLKTGSDPRSHQTNDMPGMDKRDSRVVLTDLLRQHRRLLVVGDPGSGKTTFLRFIAYVLARDGLDPDPARRKDLLGLSFGNNKSIGCEVPIPILVSVAQLAGTFAARNAGGGARHTLTETLTETLGPEKAHMLEEKLNRGQCVLLLDGLDEVGDPLIRSRMAEAVRAIIHHLRGNLIVLTSRPFGYQAIAGLDDMVTAHVCSFEEPEILQFMERWADALYPDKADRHRVTYLPELRAAVLNVPHIQRMAQNPVMLTCLCVVHWNERHLPEGKADLLSAVLRWLLSAKEEKRRARGYTSTFAGECFKALALAMCADPQGKQVIVDIAWAAEQLGRPFRDELSVKEGALRRQGMRFLEAETVDSGIVSQDVMGCLRFWHLTFQEHFAGRALTELSDGESDKNGWWKLIGPHVGDDQWNEVIDLFAGCLARTGRRRLHLLIERILKQAYGTGLTRLFRLSAEFLLGAARSGNLAHTAKVVGVLGRLLRILDVYDYQPPSRLGWDKTRNRVMAIFTPEGAASVPLHQRVAAAEALGRAGDPRFQGHKPEMLPILGNKGIQLGKYPVTVLEFKRFVDSSGYDKKRFWGDHWTIKIQEEWESPEEWDNQLEHLNRPVIGVSWYEACAFCNWLRDCTGGAYRLPSAKEWRVAATNLTGIYPWGAEEPNSELANIGPSSHSPTPVGIYPAGAAPGGHLDMAGNVLEWVLDEEHGGAGRRLRGGSWFDASTQDCRSSFSDYRVPQARYRYIGFRLALP